MYTLKILTERSTNLFAWKKRFVTKSLKKL